MIFSLRVDMLRLRFTESQIRAVLKQAEAGRPCRISAASIGLVGQRFTCSVSRYVGIDLSLTTRMQELEEEHRRFKRLYIKAQIKADIVADALVKKSKAISLTRVDSTSAVERSPITRLAYEAFGLSEVQYRYQPKLNAERAIVAD